MVSYLGDIAASPPQCPSHHLPVVLMFQWRGDSQPGWPFGDQPFLIHMRTEAQEAGWPKSLRQQNSTEPALGPCLSPMQCQTQGLGLRQLPSLPPARCDMRVSRSHGEATAGKRLQWTRLRTQFVSSQRFLESGPELTQGNFLCDIPQHTLPPVIFCPKRPPPWMFFPHDLPP